MSGGDIKRGEGENWLTAEIPKILNKNILEICKFFAAEA